MMRYFLLFLLLSCGPKPDTQEEASIEKNTSVLSTPSGKSTPTPTSTSTISTVQTTKNINDLVWDFEILSETPNYIKENYLNIKLTGLGSTDQIKGLEVAESCIGVWKFYASNQTVTVDFETRNSIVTLGVRLVDQNDNKSECKKKNIIHDNRSPSDPKISINNNSIYSRSRQVQLSIDNFTDALEMYITNTIGCTTGGTWENYAASKNWILRDYEGINTVYIKFRDVAKNETNCTEASIIYDGTPPKNPSVNIAYGALSTDVATVDLSLNATDVTKMSISDSYSACDSSTTWIDFTPIKSWTLNSKGYVYVKFKDDAGNETSCVSDYIQTSSVTLTYRWFEGRYYPTYSTCGYNVVRDYTIIKTETKTYPPFTIITTNSVGNCELSKSGNSYLCDWSYNLKNCGKIYASYMCNGYATSSLSVFPGALDCKRPIP